MVMHNSSRHTVRLRDVGQLMEIELNNLTNINHCFTDFLQTIRREYLIVHRSFTMERQLDAMQRRQSEQ